MWVRGRYDTVMHKPNLPMNVYFQSVRDRREFMTILFNFKRMYHENHVHHELYSSYRHDTKHAVVCWLVAEMDLNMVLPCKLKWQLPRAILDPGRIVVTSRVDERVLVSKLHITGRNVIELTDIEGILVGKHAANGVCTVVLDRQG